jgi:NADH:ubiquinone oxidoreductase subunit 6 (subunit J)
MPKLQALFFAVLGVLMMIATAVSLSYNGWLAALFLILTLFVIGAGFIYKARLRKRDGSN